MHILDVKLRLKEITDWRQVYRHELGEMLECAMDRIAQLEAAQLQLQADLLPCGHHKDAIVGNGTTQWCVACEAANR